MRWGDSVGVLWSRLSLAQGRSTEAFVWVGWPTLHPPFGRAVGVDVAAASYWTVPASGSSLWGFPLTQDELGDVHTLDPVPYMTGTQQPSAIVIKAAIFELVFKDS